MAGNHALPLASNKARKRWKGALIQMPIDFLSEFAARPRRRRSALRERGWALFSGLIVGAARRARLLDTLGAGGPWVLISIYSIN